MSLEELAARLPEGTLRDSDDRYRHEPRSIAVGGAATVALPRTTEEVAEIVRHCHRARRPLVPYGGGTGLVGGQIHEGDALVLSLERMDRIVSVHAQENAMTVEAGAILASVQQAAKDAGRLFPLSLGSEGSARIGGLLGTNAGGVGVLKYGNMRDLTLGIDAVLPDGTVMRGATRLRKDNTGYDIRHLLIGAEGTLGVITAASLRLFARPAQQGAAFLVVPSPAEALDLLALARDVTGDAVTAFELIGGQGLRFVAEHVPSARQPFDAPPPWSVLIEIGLPEGRPVQDVLEDVFVAAFERGLVTDGVVASSEQQRMDFWHLRESIPEANRAVGAVASHDISVPLGEIPRMIEEGTRRLARFGVRLNIFGHAGDGNLHYNAFPAEGRARGDYADVKGEITRIVHDLVRDLDGSISAEHGIGRFKAADLVRYGDPGKLAAMRAIKAALDPHGIMNPGAVLA